MDRITHSLVNYLKQNKTANDLDLQMIGILYVTGYLQEAKRHGYIIKRKYEGKIWNRKKVYYMKSNT